MNHSEGWNHRLLTSQRLGGLAMTGTKKRSILFHFWVIIGPFPVIFFEETVDTFVVIIWRVVDWVVASSETLMPVEEFFNPNWIWIKSYKIKQLDATISWIFMKSPTLKGLHPEFFYLSRYEPIEWWFCFLKNWEVIIKRKNWV